MIRVTGREFSGLSESPCYLRGKMSCISCHAMHQEVGDKRPAEDWANDQLAIEWMVTMPALNVTTPMTTVKITLTTIWPAADHAVTTAICRTPAMV